MSFNLVIERLLVSSKNPHAADAVAVAMFQSRNREAFGFKKAVYALHPVERFPRFQSRNREAFGFKVKRQSNVDVIVVCFNLVIERLLVSSRIRFVRNSICV